MAGVSYKRSLSGVCDVNERKKLGASLTVVKGEMLSLSGSLLAKATATGKVTHIAQEGETTSSSQQTEIDVLPVSEDMIFEQPFTPIHEDQSVDSGTTTTVVFTDTGNGGSNDDLNGGKVYVKELDEERVISDSAYSSDECTVTVVEPFSRAPAAGETVSACVPAEGNRAAQLDGSTPSLLVGQAANDDTSGNIIIRKVDLRKKMIEVSFVQ